MDEMAQHGAGGMPGPDREGEERRAAARTEEYAEQHEEYRAEGRPPTVPHDWPSGEPAPIHTVRSVPREAHRLEGRPPTVTHDWPAEEEAPAHRRHLLHRHRK
ncbi:hypothetical protein ACIQF6_23295 [Kitasatospora sp. NPDC092948]|uniref:hypothetical protein n=1 Tax=Kitasatospora sp. NPDC092948 TaxID=3364088 RepID=UPI0038034C29